jgi:hypothetical protein
LALRADDVASPPATLVVVVVVTVVAVVVVVAAVALRFAACAAVRNSANSGCMSAIRTPA